MNNRAELFIDDEKLFEYAANTARLITSLREENIISTAGTVKRAYNNVRKCHDEISRRYSSLPAPPASCNWIMDNFYMVQREYAALMPDLLGASHLRGCGEGLLPLYLCRNLLSCSGGAVSDKRLAVFLDGFQSVLVLRRSELELVPAMLSAAVILRLSEQLSQMRSSSEPDEYAKVFEALFTTLRLFSVIDTAKLISDADVPNRIFAADPTGEYAKMDSDTRRAYLKQLEKLARDEKADEHLYAEHLIRKAKAENVHIGKLLFPVKSHNGGLYIFANLFLTLFLSLLSGFAFHSPLSALFRTGSIMIFSGSSGETRRT